MSIEVNNDLRDQLSRTQAAHRAREDAAHAEALTRIEQWQKQRLLHTYADLSAEPRYRQATDFFIQELYAPADLAQRGHDLERMYPTMVRVLPDSVLETVARAIELEALTLELDLAMAQVAPAEVTVDAHTYGDLYRAAGQYDQRERQIELIVETGHDLDRVTHNPVIYATLKMTRLPAILAGLENLQNFLESGFDSFRRMGGAEEFLRTIERRERRIMESLIAGDDSALLTWTSS